MLLNLDHVTYYYPETETPAIADVSLELHKGDFVLLIGPSGSGKTTLLQIAAGVIPHATGGRIKGKVQVEGQDILSHPQQARGLVGLTLQDPEAQLTSLYVEDEILFGPENLCLQKEEIEKRSKWVLERARLKGLEKAFVYSLSGGQKQRVAIASGLALKPKILLMDGPTTNLDPQGATEVLTLIKELRAAGDTECVVISANKIDDLLAMANRIVVLSRGQILLDADPQTVLLEHTGLLEELGVFVPETTLIVAALRKNLPAAVPVRLPRSIQEAAEFVEKYRLASPLLNLNHSARKSEPIIQIEALHFGYGKNDIFSALDLTIWRGENVAIVGQNGSGKTTLMGLIAGLLTPQKGTVRVAGLDTKKEAPFGKVGYVFQYPEHQFVASQVSDELRLSLKAQNLSESETDSGVTETLRLFGLEDKKDHSPYILSMGEKRLLSVATMLVLKPAILILDEPTTGLDRASTTKLMQILQELVAKNEMTLIQVSHDMEQVAEYAQRVIVIDYGRIIFDDTPRRLFRQQDVLAKAQLQPPPAAKLSNLLWPDIPVQPITVAELTAEVLDAAA